MLLLACFASLVPLLACFVEGASTPDSAPRGLRQTTRNDVVNRMQLAPDGSWTAKRSTPSATPCMNDATVPGGGPCECSYFTLCGTVLPLSAGLSISAASSFSACLTQCDSNEDCLALNYQISTLTCTLALDVEVESGTPNADYDAAYFVSGSCDGTC